MRERCRWRRSRLRPKRERDGAEEAIGGMVSFPSPEEMAEQICAMAATRGGEGGSGSS